MKERRGNGGDIRDLLGKLLGPENVPDDCVLKAILNDQRLQKLAEYDVTRGYMNVNVTAEELQAKFTEFKTMVMKKSSTLAELESTVFSRWGILEKPRNEMPVEQMSIPDMSGIRFADKKPITGFASPNKNQDK